MCSSDLHTYPSFGGPPLVLIFLRGQKKPFDAMNGRMDKQMVRQRTPISHQAVRTIRRFRITGRAGYTVSNNRGRSAGYLAAGQIKRQPHDVRGACPAKGRKCRQLPFFPAVCVSCGVLQAIGESVLFQYADLITHTALSTTQRTSRAGTCRAPCPLFCHPEGCAQGGRIQTDKKK